MMVFGRSRVRSSRGYKNLASIWIWRSLKSPGKVGRGRNHHKYHGSNDDSQTISKDNSGDCATSINRTPKHTGRLG